MTIEAIKREYENDYLIYNRRSTDDAVNQQNSLAYQRQRNVEYAAREGFTIAKLTIPGLCTNGIIDESHSAFKEEDEFILLPDGATQYRILRPKFAQLIQLLKEKKIKGVIFLCWHRASRNEHDDMIIKKLERLGCEIWFTEARYDDGSTGDFHKDMDGAFARHYSRVISDGVHKAYKKLHDEGKCTQLTPIGYMDNGSSDKPLDPLRAPIVKRIFDLYSTGEWSFTDLAEWAVGQGLTKKPRRRNRTKEELANNVEADSMPQAARPVDRKTIELVLRNRFYLGEMKLVSGEWRRSNVHQSLIDTELFNKVQRVLKTRTLSMHYDEEEFYTYRELLRCSCGRLYSPYTKKGIIYYRSRCSESCENCDPNLNSTEVDAAVQKLMDGISFTPDELRDIEARGKSQIEEIAARRDRELGDLHGRQQKLTADLAYITENRITLLRTGDMTADEIRTESERLNGSIAAVQNDIRAHGESAKGMLRYVLTFSELAHNASRYFSHALDNEKRDLVAQMFTELVFENRSLKSYKARDGFAALLERGQKRNSGAQERT